MAIFADITYLIAICLLIILPLYLYRQSHHRILRVTCVVYIILTILFIADVFVGFPNIISRYAALGLIPTGIIICIATFVAEKDTRFRATSIVSAILPFILLFLLTTICSVLLGFGPCIPA